MACLSFTILASILHNAEARPSFLRMYTNDANEDRQGNFLTSLVSKFSDEQSAKAITVKLLEGVSDDDENWTYVVLETLERLKQQVQDNHDQAQRDVNRAEEQIQNCTDDMNAAQGDIQQLEGSCNANSSNHKTCRNHQDSLLKEWDTSYHKLKGAEAEKQQNCTELHETLQSFKSQAQVLQTMSSQWHDDLWHGTGWESSVWDAQWPDEQAKAEEYTHFCNEWDRTFANVRDGCKHAVAAFEGDISNWSEKQTAYLTHRQTCNDKQISMDTACCEYSLKTEEVCEDLDQCRLNGLTHRNETHDRVEKEEIQRQFEWEVYEKIGCFLGMLQEGNAIDVDAAQCEVNSSHLQISYPAIPACPICNVDEAWPGSDAYADKTELDVDSTNETYEETPWGPNDKPPAASIQVLNTAVCTGMMS